MDKVVLTVSFLFFYDVFVLLSAYHRDVSFHTHTFYFKLTTIVIHIEFHLYI